MARLSGDLKGMQTDVNELSKIADRWLASPFADLLGRLEAVFSTLVFWTALQGLASLLTGLAFLLLSLTPSE